MNTPRTIFESSDSPQPSPKKPNSPKKIEANRRNALRSTGPRTAQGKTTVARNAIKHGLLAREVVITAGDGKEQQEEFSTLFARLCEHYQPIGVIEEMLVERIATSWWRLARALRAENGEIRQRLGCFYAVPPEAKSERSPTENIEEKPADRKRTVLEALIDSKLEAIGALKEYASEREKVEVDAERRRYSLAAKDAMDKLLRYEAQIERQIYRAMDQLERMQRQRRGEAVPPPLNVNLGRRG